ncbi:MAG: hypothetical protein UY28_C0004G0048 [Candidatus Amesbacteria bacterium GW2011_GWB1_48_13]|uniref:Major capsid protein n=1 Tax=Candidatus Amesbacteria bacterium GW2011_GWB1_48_13 TaxID=1618362 RepID=A0A0G1XVH4_9BACT|nr:MAG: hypothetical protein UY28_C0004G0048 [Candidatus Amesbacteria bacterium GW2011_GWB1_48_13]
MAETLVPLNDATAVVIYSRLLFFQAVRSTVAAKLMAVGLKADDKTNFVQMFDEPMKGPGDTVKYDLIPNISGPGVLGDSPIAGQEVPFTWFQDSFVINQQRQAELLVGRMSQQRVPYSMRDAGKTTLANWWKENIDTGLLNQLGGNTAQTNVAYTGLQAAVAPDADHHIFGGDATSEATLDSSDTFSVNLIPELIAKAQGTLTWPIKPVVLKGIEVAGILFLHPLQVKALKTNFTTGEWGDIYRAALQGGQITGNPIFTGAIGMYENVVIHQDARVPYGDNTQNLVFDPITKTKVAAPRPAWRAGSLWALRRRPSASAARRDPMGSPSGYDGTRNF